MNKDKLNKFSISLGLLDYGNPIIYTITMLIIMNNYLTKIQSPYNIILLIGITISIIFGFIIPTGKVLVGLNIIKFKMPVSLVLCVNLGIFLTGLSLLQYILNIKLKGQISIIALTILLFYLIYKKNKKINTIAVLIGAIGYLMIYSSLIITSIKNNTILPIIIFLNAIILFLILCTIGIKANLYKPKTHWIIESLNILCQLLVLIGTIILLQ